MKKIIVILIMLCFTVGCSSAEKDDSRGIVQGDVGLNEPIKRSQAAKMLALFVYDTDTIENMERTIKFEDTDSSRPYDKYINAAFRAGLISGADETHFEPDAYLSLEQASFLLKKLDKSATLRLKYDHEDRKKPIAAAMWTEIFERATQLNGNGAIVSSSLIPYASGKNCPELGERFVMTDMGLMSVECCDGFDYTDCTVSVLMRNKEILAVKSVVNTSPSVTGAVVKSTDEKGALIDLGGVERYFYADEGINFSTGENIAFTYNGNLITAVEKTIPESAELGL